MALSDHQKTSILLRVSQGETPAAIARALGIHRATVGRFVKRSKEPGKATKKRGRGSELVAFRVSGGELDGLDRLISGGVFKNRSDGFRKMLRILTGYFDPDQAYEADLRALVTEVSAIGRNVNQATREFHKVKMNLGIAQISSEHLVEIRSVGRRLEDIEAALMSVLDRRDLTTAQLITQIRDLSDG